jgi:hypothetical protein
MLAIVNVTEDHTQELDDYEIRINHRVIGKFKHKRTPNGAAQCLRDAADALDAHRMDLDVISLLEECLRNATKG